MIALHALKNVEATRLAKAATALMEGSYIITVSRCTEHAVSGCVRGKGAAYQVTLTATSVHCECPDSRFHHRHCKHVAMLALTIVRAVQAVEEKRYHLGDEVERDGMKGKVIALSGHLVSVAWNNGRIGPIERHLVAA
ncbi:MAG: hypothetical protein FJ147_04875 [Deltaproteobacteria bacterium]|nr:hypothetical protein [Deltaproteobacteria bacterium]